MLSAHQSHPGGAIHLQSRLPLRHLLLICASIALAACSPKTSATDQESKDLDTKNGGTAESRDAKLEEGWPLHSLVPGNWTVIQPDKLSEFRDRVRASLASEDFLWGYLKLNNITKVRITYLPFNGTFLAEALVPFGSITEAQKSAEIVPDGLLTGVIYLLLDDKGQATGFRTVFLTGHLESVLKVNSGAPLKLDSAANVASYLKFYCASVYDVGGNFSIIERQEEIHWSEEPDPKFRQAVADQVKPLDIKKETAGNWSATGTFSTVLKCCR
jgi:hypothetical protein